MSSELEDLLDAYRGLLHLVGKEFNRNLQVYSGRMQCRRGCFSCCYQVFRISLIDAAVISRAVKTLDPAARIKLQAKARAYLQAKEALIRERATKMGLEEEEAPTLGLRLPCPILEDGICTLYEARPLICRKFGMLIYDPKKPHRLWTCELNFKDGEAVDAVELIKNQTEISEQWDALKTRVHQRTGHPTGATTIAEAILYDYEAFLEEATGSLRLLN